MKKGHLVGLAMGLFLVCIGMVGNAKATLISQDLSTVGDGYLTYDSDTRLSWLDVPLTVNHSYNEVMSGYGGYTTTLGFRYATGDEIVRLFSNAGVVQTSSWIWGYWNFSNPNYLANATLVSLLGVTYPFDGLITGILGITGSNIFGTTGSHDYATIQYNNHADYYAFQAVAPWDDIAKNTVVGSFLVKDSDPVPEPATMLLFGTGLASLAAVGRRKRD